MKLLVNWRIQHGYQEHRIELLQGDLSKIPVDHAVDLLVVSAFPNDYSPTPFSLIGSLAQAGVSVAELSKSKLIDMREEFSCWLSAPVPPGHGFRHLLCIESGWRGTAPEITDELFRAAAPLFVTGFTGSTMAMPILAAGDQGWPPEEMLESLLRAAVSWMRRGLAIHVLKIVVFSPIIAESLTERFIQLRRELGEDRSLVLGSGAWGLNEVDTVPEAGTESTDAYDLFISYSHADSAVAQTVAAKAALLVPRARVFFDRQRLKPGASWLMEIADALDRARRVLALYTPNYWSSRYCKDEFAAALARQMDTGQEILFPVYFQNAPIPYLFRNIQYVDCRESDIGKFDAVCDDLCRALMLSPG